MEKKWVIPKGIDKTASEELKNFPIPIRQLLFSRGYMTQAEADTFLECAYRDEDPFRLKDMKAAIERLRQAIINNETIAIYGDYDVDGVTATALLIEVIRGLGGTAIEYIPNRFDEGYGLNPEALDFLHGQHANVVVTVDCGIRSPQEARHARDLGIDLIISDHHHPKGGVPEAVAVICQKQPGDDYPNKDLAGVGLAYKIGQALCQVFPDRYIDIGNWLDLVALGTVADVVPLTGENRFLVHAGIQKLRSGKRLGLIRLANVSDTNLSAVSSYEIGFRLAPRLNASGRLESALDSLHLLLTTNDKEAAELAMKLDMQNRERQRITRDIQQRAEELTTHDESSFLMFAVDEGFNQGVVGLAASRLVEKYYRPAIVAARGDTQTRGSCRSIPEFHITNALDECAHLLIRHGGHAMAAGFTVANENVSELECRLKEISRAQLHALALMPTLKVDAVCNLSELRPELMAFLEKFQPTGLGNPEPLFLVRGMKIKGAWQVGAERSHLKLTLTDGRVTFDAIAFRMGECYNHLPHDVDAVFSFELNNYLDRQILQLNIKDMRASGQLDNVP